MKDDFEVYLEPTDRIVLHLDVIQKIKVLPGLQARLRMAFVNADDTLNGWDPSYNEFRFELNYLF